MYDIPEAPEATTADEFREAIDNVVTSYQAERISAPRALAAIAAIIADDESGTEV